MSATNASSSTGVYNATLWNDDVAHFSRTVLNVSYAGTLTLILPVLFIFVFFRMKMYPLKAHGYLFQILKAVGSLYIAAFFTSFMFMNRLATSIFLMYLPLASLYPTLQRFVSACNFSFLNFIFNLADVGLFTLRFNLRC